ncbi:hypothetical protein Franean1_2921 [Parafrankia sp. EAN1pec]|uniref:nuclear transport factor 2 family protein n=1 Tax=Parafrankia sp. (strain EAN1pec) TaxID=298653 RepID=UPI00005416FF|nr:hypothetical protein Franean1_2921 [Frankia sp. EAN1pec]
MSQGPIEPGSAEPLSIRWIDRLEIRDVIERSMRYTDDQAGDLLAELFDDDGVLQLAGTVFSGRESIRKMFPAAPRPSWTEPGQLLRQPRAAHRASNPVIDIDGDTATAETDLLVLARDETGRPRITLIARYRDRLRRLHRHQWVITNRTGVSIARPGEEDTDAEWARALERMPEKTRAMFRTH